MGCIGIAYRKMELVCIFWNIVTKKKTDKQTKITVEWESFVDIVGMKRDFKDNFYFWSFAAFRTSLDVRKGKRQSCALCEWFAEWWKENVRQALLVYTAFNEWARNANFPFKLPFELTLRSPICQGHHFLFEFLPPTILALSSTGLSPQGV